VSDHDLLALLTQRSASLPIETNSWMVRLRGPWRDSKDSNSVGCDPRAPRRDAGEALRAEL